MEERIFEPYMAHDETQWVEYAAPLAEVGTLHIGLGADGVREVRLAGHEHLDGAPGPDGVQLAEVRIRVLRWLDRYFADSKETVEPFPASLLDLHGTEFEQEVWRQMLKIPFGQVCTYGQIASAIGRPGAARAVGTACAKNRLPILVPCHRVVASNGALGGYSAGLGPGTKMALLQHEGGHEGVGSCC